MEDEKEAIYIQYGDVRLFGISLVVGWFGVAAIPFPKLQQIEENTYVLENRLYGSYLNLLPPWYTMDKGGNWTYINETKRQRINEAYLTIRIKLTLGEDYVDVSIEAVDKPNILMQLVCKTDLDSKINGNNAKNLLININTPCKKTIRFRAFSRFKHGFSQQRCRIGSANS